jgi:hypothetical protein
MILLEQGEDSLHYNIDHNSNSTRHKQLYLYSVFFCTTIYFPWRYELQINVTVFRDIRPCSQVQDEKRLGGTFSFRLQEPKDFSSDYMASRPTRL